MRVLVVTASRHGSTQEIADRIGTKLAESGFDVDVQSADAAVEPDQYDAVVLGSGVYAGSWVKTGVAYVDSHDSTLRDMPVWVFSSGPLGDPPKPDPTEAVKIDSILERVNPVEHVLLPGSMEKSNLNLAERAVVKMVKAPYGDFRDWDAVEAFADRIVAGLG